MVNFRGFKKQEKAIKRTAEKIKKAILKNQESKVQLKVGMIKKKIELRRSILAKHPGFFKESEEPRKQMVFMGRA